MIPAKIIRAAIIGGAATWCALPQIASADNCSGLGDCYFTVASGIGVASAIGIGALLIVFWSDIVQAFGNVFTGTELGADPVEPTTTDTVPSETGPGTIAEPGTADLPPHVSGHVPGETYTGDPTPAGHDVPVGGVGHTGGTSPTSPDGSIGSINPPAQPGHSGSPSDPASTGPTVGQPVGHEPGSGAPTQTDPHQTDATPVAHAGPGAPGDGHTSTPAAHPLDGSSPVSGQSPTPTIGTPPSPAMQPVQGAAAVVPGGNAPHQTPGSSGVTNAGHAAGSPDASVAGQPISTDASTSLHPGHGVASPVSHPAQVSQNQSELPPAPPISEGRDFRAPDHATGSYGEQSTPDAGSPPAGEEIQIAPEGKMIQGGQVVDAEPGVAPEGMAISAGRLVPADGSAVAANEPLIAPEGMAVEGGQLVAAHVPSDIQIAGEGQALVAGTPVSISDDPVAGLIADEARKLAEKIPPASA